jgi:hydroxymethylpyrimidine/phosphomethylpyrimidine kinase
MRARDRGTSESQGAPGNDPNSSGLAPVVGVITSNVFELDFVLDRRKRRKERIDKEKKKKKNLKS